MQLIDSLESGYRALRRSTADYFYWKRFVLQLRFRADRWYVVCPQGIGDTYLVCALLKAFSQQQQNKIVVVVKQPHLGVACLFPDGISEIVTVDHFRLPLLAQRSKRLPGHPFMAHPSQLPEELDAVLGDGGVNLLDLYKRLLGLSENAALSKPKVHPQSAESALNRLQTNNLPVGKTVILAPAARSVSMFPLTFWCDLADRLKQLGWTVCTNAYDDSSCIPHTFRLQFPLDEAISIVEQAGWMISVRSGLCDLVSTAECRLSVIYPREKWHAGTPLSAASLLDMGLSATALEYEIGDSDNLQIMSEMIVNGELATVR